jgi:hypothetical protein
LGSSFPKHASAPNKQYEADNISLHGGECDQWSTRIQLEIGSNGKTFSPPIHRQWNGRRNPRSLAFHIAAFALAFLDFSFRGAPPVGSEKDRCCRQILFMLGGHGRSLAAASAASRHCNQELALTSASRRS